MNVGISYSELHRWIRSKIDTEGGSWKVFMVNPEVIQFAHVQSCSLYQRHDTVLKKKVIGIDDFRTFLVHFFAISVLWVHFKNADEFMYSNDFGNLKLTFEEFKLAVKTLTATHEKEELSDEQLMEDFVKLDHDQSNSLGFVEVQRLEYHELMMVYCANIVYRMFDCRCALTAVSTLIRNFPRRANHSGHPQCRLQSKPCRTKKTNRKSALWATSSSPTIAVSRTWSSRMMYWQSSRKLPK